MPTKRQRRKRRRRIADGDGNPTASARPSAVAVDEAQRAKASARRGVPGKAAPQALWGSFPLSELVVLIALVLLVVGFFVGGHRGGVMMIVGICLGTLAGLELAAREHFSGYRSHNLLLAAVGGMATFAVLILLTPLTPVLCVAAAVGVSSGSAWLLIQAFRRRSGGAAYRIKPG